MLFNSILLAGAVLAQASSVALAAAPQVKINSTTIIGAPTGNVSDKGVPIAAYLGIPFAPKPVRFSPSKPYLLPAGTFNAKAFGPICYQEFPGPGGPFTKLTFTTGAPAEDEDCLSLNIWTPQAADKAPVPKSLPVMVWIFGGALLFGGSGQPSYDGTKLASKDVVIVTINYRTNVFGFPGAAQLPIKQQNLGFLDQRNALSWVQKNIAAFGGDPSKVTIFGESAGAVSAESLLLEGGATPPFRAVIQDSGVSKPFVVRPIGVLFPVLAGAAGCGNSTGDAQLTCMRAVPAPQLVALEQAINLPFGAMVDNVTYFEDGAARRASGKAAKVPTVIGSNQDDGNLFVVGTTNFTDFLVKNFPGAPIPLLQSLYPIGVTKKYKTDEEAAAAAFRDAIFQCKARIDSAIHATHVGKAYRYLYQAVFANQQPIPNAGAYHSSELPLLFGNLKPLSTKPQIDLSNLIRTAATTFAKDPSVSPWSPMTGKTTDTLLVVANDTRISQKPQDNYDATCKAVWDTYLLGGRSLKTFAALD